jgi:hypothetical protein
MSRAQIFAGTEPRATQRQRPTRQSGWLFCQSAMADCDWTKHAVGELIS